MFCLMAAAQNSHGGGGRDPGELNWSSFPLLECASLKAVIVSCSKVPSPMPL